MYMEESEIDNLAEKIRAVVEEYHPQELTRALQDLKTWLNKYDQDKKDEEFILSCCC